MARTKGFDPDEAVDKAMEVFWEHGYAGTTPQRLVEALGIGRGSLYNAFEGKHALYERALRRYHEREASRVIDLLDGSGPARDRIRAVLDMVVEAALRDRRGCFIVNAAVEPTGGDEIVHLLARRTFDRQEAAFRGAIEEGQRAGEIAKDADAAALAALLVTTTNGIRVQAKVNPDAERLRALAGAALRAL